jgi:hypothetical protein
MLQMRKRRKLIMAEHMLPTARNQLKEQLKAWIARDEFKARTALANRVQAAAELPEYDV